MTKEQQLSMLEALCDNIYKMGQNAMDADKEPRKRISTMITIAGAFMGGYAAYLRRKDGDVKDMLGDMVAELRSDSIRKNMLKDVK